MAGDDIRLTELTNRLETPMTSPTQRRHDEILGRLDALIDAVQSTTARDSLHRLLAEESAAERRDETVDVTEEPPVGSQVVDKDGDVWERNFNGWGCVTRGGRGEEHGWSRVVRGYAPLRPASDRERVGLPVHSHLWDHCEQNVTSKGYVMPAYEVCMECGATRTPPEPVDTAPDVDPDEALARVLRSAKGATLGMALDDRWMALARAAREHIETEVREDVERLTRERDEALARAETDRLQINRLTRERDEAETSRDREANRYEALRADVETWARGHTYPLRGGIVYSASQILDRDDERGRGA